MFSKIKRYINAIYRKKEKMPENVSNYTKIKECTKTLTTYELVQELNRRKNENHDGCEINFTLGKNTGDIHIGNQTPYGKNHICHACGLGYKCLDKDCPNTKINTNDIFMYQPIDDGSELSIPSGGSNVTKN